MKKIVPDYSSMPSGIPGERILVIDYGDKIDTMPYDDSMSIGQAIEVHRREKWVKKRKWRTL